MTKIIEINEKIVSSPKEALNSIMGVSFSARSRAVIKVDGVNKSLAFRRAAFLADKLTKEVVNNGSILGDDAIMLREAAFEALANAAAGK